MSVFVIVFNSVFVIVFNSVFVYVFSNFANATTFKRRDHHDFFQPTSERTHALLASLSLFNFLFLLPLAFSSYCFLFLPS